MLRRWAQEGWTALQRRARERAVALAHAVDLRYRVAMRLRSVAITAVRELSGFQAKETDGERALWVFRWHDVRRVLNDPSRFSVSVSGQRMRQSIGPFFLGLDPGAAAPTVPGEPWYEDDAGAMRDALEVPHPDFAATQQAWRRLGQVRALAEELASERVRAALERTGEIDVVGDLADAVPLAFALRFYGLSDTDGGEGLLSGLRAASSYVFGVDVADKLPAAVSGGRMVAAHVLALVRERIRQRASGVPSADHVLDRLIEGRYASVPNRDEAIARLLVGTLSGTIIPTAWIFIEAVDRLLRLPRKQREALSRSAQIGDRSAVRAYVLEAIRFFPFPPLLLRRALEPTRIGGRRVEAGALVVLVLTAASMDWRRFRRPFSFRPGRPDEGSLIFGTGPHHCMGRAIGETLLTEMALALFAQRRLRRARGNRGHLEYEPRTGVPDGPYPKHLVLEASGWSA